MRINIVTINLNNKVGLERTMNSVLSQTFFDHIDYIIIDGGSTDGSKELIEQHKDKLYYWCSEQDNGIFNAMNKGIDHLNGEYVLFLNSGDFLDKNDVIEKVYDQLDCDIVYGNEMMYSIPNQGMVSYTKVTSFNKWLSKYPDKLDERFFKTNALPHQSTFIKTSLQKQHKYDESCIIAGDWKFLREAVMKYGATYKHIATIISNYGLDGVSSKQFRTFQQEKNNYYKAFDK